MRSVSPLVSPLAASSAPPVDWQAGIKRLLGNEALFRKLLAMFVRDYADVGKRLHCLVTESPAEAELLVHTLKGVSSNLSMPRLYELVKITETALPQDDSAQLAFILDELTQEIEAVVNHINANTP